MTIIETLIQLRDDLKTWVTNNLRTKVDKVDGQGLSTNDFTTDEKSKLSSVAYGANNYVLPYAGQNMGGVKTGGDVTIDSGVITVNDDSHNHTFATVTGLQDVLNSKSDSDHKHTAADVGAVASVNGRTGAVTLTPADIGAVASADMTNDLSFVSYTFELDSSWEKKIAYGNGVYIVTTGSTTILRSSDGITWVTDTLPVQANGIAFGNGMFCTYQWYKNTIAYSADGITWNTATTIPAVGIGNSQYCITFANDRFLISNDTYILYSTDCVTWNEYEMPYFYFNQAAYGNGVYVVVGDDGVCATSSDGEIWTEGSMPTGDHYDCVIFANGKFIALTSSKSSFLACSVDGINWTTSVLPVSDNWHGIAYGEGRFIAVGSTTIISSANATDWSIETVPNDATGLDNIAYGNGVFAIPSDKGIVRGTTANIYGLLFKANFVFDAATRTLNITL